MNKDDNNQHEVQHAIVSQSRRISKIWLIPLLALSIGVWMVYHQWANQGPLITIEFVSATGIEADKTKIRTKDVQVGVVKKVALKADMSGVLVTARIEPSAAHLLKSNSSFWLVRPRVSLSGVSGLSTLLSGPYITLEPSQDDNVNESVEPITSYVALENPPVTPAGTPGLQITLNSNAEFAFKEGDPIVYKGLKVGEFEDIYFNVEERVVYYNAFIEAPYHKLITENTKFWNTSGVRFELAANGIEVQTGSLETMLTNGVTFGIPQGMPAGDVITKRAYFDIYRDYDTAVNERYKLGVNFIILIKDTIRGLTVGAPVEYRGLEIGKVLEINLPGVANEEFLDEGYAIPILITIQPSRVQQPDNRQGAVFVKSQILRWVDQGLRASLKIGNIITGGLYVDLQHYEDLDQHTPQTFLGYNVIPTTSGEFAQITQKVSDVLDNINTIPFAELSTRASTLLATLNQTGQSIEQTAGSLNQVLRDVTDQSTSDHLNDTLISLDGLLKDYSQGSDSNDELISTMQKFQLTLDQLAPLLQQLNQTPNSLIFADGTQPVIEPRAKNTGNKDGNNE
ncbi:intermembrane transport protein PqiB [Aliiglaciecola sp. LCG003]|uniref:intermembrane transport protein PqiB n=1 Tax=Aliiglaciecola sp. LCG003 TaxID=3053655 RepID=UPI0025724B17|nr:intermembrane transport protein PqiB [Aliiglaciecola sp. LCG003]WJG08063.1 intermembrane transport protein PqiB [Aliiglaciecola sp. LCG003]